MVTKDKYWNIAERISFLAQKDVLNIPYLTHDTAFKITNHFPWKANELKQYIIFNLTVEDLTQIKGFGKSKAKQLLASIGQASINVPFHRFLRAAGAGFLSENICIKLADSFKSLNEMETKISPTVPVEDATRTLLSISGMEPNIASIVVSEEFWDNITLLRRFATISY